jgi:hypothetical protein
MPEFFLTERYPAGLENDFTVVWWEQRGAGLLRLLPYPGLPPLISRRRWFPAGRTGAGGSWC